MIVQRKSKEEAILYRQNMLPKGKNRAVDPIACKNCTHPTPNAIRTQTRTHKHGSSYQESWRYIDAAELLGIDFPKRTPTSKPPDEVGRYNRFLGVNFHLSYSWVFNSSTPFATSSTSAFSAFRSTDGLTVSNCTACKAGF
jgi:hypothetical protein